MNADARIWTLTEGDGPLVASAIHAGHELRPELHEYLSLPRADRLREEDPFTDLWTTIAPTRVVATRSRFEVDLNRPRASAVYLEPEDAWGLRVWRRVPTPDVLVRSLAGYDAFYAFLGELLARKVAQHGRFMLFDLHSYNHRRDGPAAEPAPAADNPEVNLGTGTMRRERWSRLVERFQQDLAAFPMPGGGRLDVRENVRFRGGNLSRWVHETFPEAGCALAVEIKKTFMDEWTGEPESSALEALRTALAATVPGVLEELGAS